MYITLLMQTCSALRVIELHGHQQKVYTIEREIHEKCCVTQRVKTYLTSQGRILMHDWLDTPYIAQTNPLYMQDERSEIADMQIPLRERWMQDIEMLSKYLDTKVILICSISQHILYDENNRRIRILFIINISFFLLKNIYIDIPFNVKTVSKITRDTLLYL